MVLGIVGLQCLITRWKKFTSVRWKFYGYIWAFFSKFFKLPLDIGDIFNFFPSLLNWYKVVILSFIDKHGLDISSTSRRCNFYDCNVHHSRFIQTKSRNDIFRQDFRSIQITIWIVTNEERKMWLKRWKNYDYRTPAKQCF